MEAERSPRPEKIVIRVAGGRDSDRIYIADERPLSNRPPQCPRVWARCESHILRGMLRVLGSCFTLAFTDSESIFYFWGGAAILPPLLQAVNCVYWLESAALGGFIIDILSIGIIGYIFSLQTPNPGSLSIRVGKSS